MGSCEIKFGPSQTIQLPIIQLADDLYECDPTVLTTLRLDNSNLCKPCVKLDFITSLSVFGMSAGTFKFQIFKKFDNQIESIPVGPAWTFDPAKSGVCPVSFFVSDCDMTCCSKNTCCTYLVRVSATKLTVGPVGYATFINSMLAATISDCGSCRCK